MAIDFGSFDWPAEGSGGGGGSVNSVTASSPLFSSGGANPNITIQVANSTQNGYLSSADWNTFNNKQSALTFGDLTDVGTDGIVVTGGTGAVIGAGTSLAQHVADTTHNGYLSSVDWNTFNNKEDAGTSWLLVGNAGTAPGTNFLGTTDAQDLQVQTNGSLQLTFRETGGFVSNQTIVPASAVSTNQYEFTTNVNPAGNSNSDQNTGIRNTLIHDGPNSGFDYNGTLFAMGDRLEVRGTGDVDNAFLFDGSVFFDNVAGITSLFKGINLDAQVGTGYTVSNYNGVNSYLGGTGSIFDGVSLYNSNTDLTDVTANNVTLLSSNIDIIGASAIAQNFTAIGSNQSVSGSTTVNGMFATNMGIGFSNTSQTNNINGNNLNIQLQDTASCTGGITGFNTGIDIRDGATVTGGVSGVNTNLQVRNTAVVGNVTAGSFGVSTSDTAVLSSLTGVNCNPDIAGSSTVGNLNIASFGGNVQDSCTLTNYTGLLISPVLQGSSTAVNFSPLQVSGTINGTATVTNGVTLATFNLNTATNVPNANGVSINIDNAMTASPFSKTALSSSGGSFNASYSYTIPGATTYFQTHYIGGGQAVALGDPTAAYGFGTNMAPTIQFNDNWTADVTGLRLGYNSVGFVGSIVGAAGKTMDSWTGALAGAGNPSGAGTIDQAIMFRAAGILPEGGSIAVNNVYGLMVMPTLTAVSPTNAWGVWVGDTNADNWFAKNVVIGGATGKPTGAFALDVTGSARFGNITEINTVPYSFTNTQGAASTVLTNDGSGNLTWAASGGSGTVTSVSVVSANGLAGTVATATTTPAITLSTTITASILAGDGTAISAAALPSGDIFVGSAGNLPVAVAMSGDATIVASGALTLATVNGNVGSFGSSTSIPSFTVNAKGLITAASGNVVIAPAGTLTGTTLNATVVNSSLTSVGTITSGVWNGTTIAIANGGTGQTTKTAAFDALSPMTTGGDLIYGGASGTGTRLANGTAGQVLTSAGTTAAPTWATPATGSVTSVSVVSANGLAGTVATATTTPAITLSTTVTASILAGNGTSISAAALSSGNIFVGSAGNLPVSVTMSGDATIVASGALTIANNAVSNAKLAQMPTLTIKGNNTGGTANALDLTVAQVNTMLGDLLIANNLSDVASKSTSFNNLSPMTTGGDLIYGGASGAGTRLANGTAGQVLTSAGTTAAPTWATPTTGTVTSVSVVSANGLAGTVATATTTPAITLSTSITGILQGNGTAISAATTGNLTDVGTDGITVTGGTGAVLGSGTSIAQHVADTTHNGYLSSSDWNTFNGKGSGSVTSVALTVPAFLSVSGSPVTTSGTLAVSFSGTAIPIANGGTSATTKSGAFDALSPMTTGGDLIYGGASGTGTRLANGSSGQVLTSGGGTAAPTWTTPTTGTVTSVALTVPAIMSVSGSPVTTSGTLAVSLATQSANTVWAGPASGAAATPTFRALTVADETIATQAVSASSIDWTTGYIFTKTLSANTTFTFTGQLTGQTIVVRLTNTASNFTVTWPSVRWAGGSAPTMSPGAVSDVYTFINDGSNFYGSVVQNMS